MNKIILEFTSALLIFLFLYTGLSKLIDFTQFARTLLHSPILAPFHIAIAVVLPIIEISIGIILFFRRYRLLGLTLSAILLLLFTGYVALILFKYAGSLPCTCGGLIASMGWKTHLLFNSAVLSLILYACWISRPLKRAISPQTAPENVNEIISITKIETS